MVFDSVHGLAIKMPEITTGTPYQSSSFSIEAEIDELKSLL
jgi:hypothetical protein